MPVRVRPGRPFFMKVTLNGSFLNAEQIGAVVGAWTGSILVVVFEVLFTYCSWNWFIGPQLNMPQSTLAQVAAVILLRNLILSPITLALNKSKEGN